MLSRSLLPYLIHQDGVCAELQSRIQCTFQGTCSTSWAQHVSISIPISTRPARTACHLQLNPEFTSFNKCLSYSSSQLFPLVDGIGLLPTCSILAVSKSFFQLKNMVYSYQTSYTSLCNYNPSFTEDMSFCSVRCSSSKPQPRSNLAHRLHPINFKFCGPSICQRPININHSII